MIITDKAAVNTGKHSGAVFLLIKERMPKTPTYNACQQHVLDRSLKIFIEKIYIGFTKSISREIDLEIVSYLRLHFHKLVRLYKGKTSPDEPIFNVAGNFLRGDYKYQFLLWKAYDSEKEYPNISFVIPQVKGDEFSSVFFFHGMVSCS